jgi:hypothetical protein
LTRASNSAATRQAIRFVLLAAIAAAIPSSARAQSIEWIRQFGTTGVDQATGLGVDATGVYVAATVGAVLPGQVSAGRQDVAVRKYDFTGNVLWTRQFGSSNFENVFGLAAGPTGVFAAGRTAGAFPMQTNAGGDDAFVQAYDLDGNFLWTRQYGTGGDDRATRPSVDATGIYVFGFAGAALPGQTSAGGEDAYVRKYDFAGNELWTRQFGTAEQDSSSGGVSDGTFLYVVGGTDGALPGQASAGGRDAFVRCYDVNGNLQWTRQFGTPLTDTAVRVALDPSGPSKSTWNPRRST